MPAGRPRQLDSADRILEASEKVFAKHGYGETSLRQLMAAAEVSTTAFYARFASKEAVLAALSARLFADLYEAAPTVLDRVKDLATGIDAGVDLLIAQFAPRRALVKMILSEAGSVPAALDARRKAYELLVMFLAARLGGSTPKAWALVGALEIQIVRWAVWEAIETKALREQLRDTARAILRTEKKR